MWRQLDCEGGLVKTFGKCQYLIKDEEGEYRMYFRQLGDEEWNFFDLTMGSQPHSKQKCRKHAIQHNYLEGTGMRFNKEVMRQKKTRLVDRVAELTYMGFDQLLKEMNDVIPSFKLENPDGTCAAHHRILLRGLIVDAIEREFPEHQLS